MNNKQKRAIRYDIGQRVINLVDSVGCNLAEDDFPNGAESDVLEYINATVKKVLKGADARAWKMYRESK